MGKAAQDFSHALWLAVQEQDKKGDGYKTQGGMTQKNIIWLGSTKTENKREKKLKRWSSLGSKY